MDESQFKNFADKLTNLTLSLQKEVAELKEDTTVNAMHIACLKQSSKENLDNLNDSVQSINSTTHEAVSSLAEEFGKNGTNNYADFLKQLLESDFKNLQFEMIENAKRELLSAKTTEKKKEKNPFLAFLQFITPFLGLITFLLLMLICLKFKLFGKLF